MSGLDAVLDQLCLEFKKGNLDIEKFRATVKTLGFHFETVIADRGIHIGGDAKKNVIISGNGNVVQIGTAPGSDPAEIRSIYLNHLIKSLKHLPLRGIDRESSDPAGNKDRLELDRVYVALDTKT